jgi:hypothetical protein
MKLAEGYFGTADMLEFNARYTHFPRGYGLPGRVWKKNRPLIVKNMLRSTAFLRWQQAMEVGINRALGIPYTHASGHSWVLTLLSARGTPIARRFEFWVPNATLDALTFESGDCDQNTSLDAGYQNAAIGKGQGLIGQVWSSQLPAVSTRLAEDASPAGKSAMAAGLGMAVALPFIDQRGLTAVLAWYL